MVIVSIVVGVGLEREEETKKIYFKYHVIDNRINLLIGFVSMRMINAKIKQQLVESSLLR